ncbi:MAG: hypothetical protein K8R59_03970 [Thermoanaerobaculales bacterium]|nr:hypothetical protein [Thermoanaerobaculales bacterium]
MKYTASFALGCVLVAMMASGTEVERRWENPVFDSESAAVAAAVAELPMLDADSPHALHMFVDFTLGDSDQRGNGHRANAKSETIGDFLLTRPASSNHNETQRRTIERFRESIPPEQLVIARRLARFGFPDLDGMVWCRMVENVDAFSGLKPPSSDKMSRVGGVTYYCRYIMLPLSYIGADAIRELRRSAGLNPSVNIGDTLRRWQRESFANLVSTFRHELVHVHINSGLGVPAYSNRSRLPTWFHEGTATYLSGDPHAGLSTRYQQYQNLFFYLVQRHGVAGLRSFYTAIFEGNDVATALKSVYRMDSAEQLYEQAGRRHRLVNSLRIAFWVVGLVIVAAAFRGINLPVLGALLVLLAVALATSLVFGLAEHLQGLNGATAVLAAKGVITLLAVTAGAAGLARIRNHRRTLD